MSNEERLVIWVMVFFIALCCGLALNSVTIFWVSLVALWIARTERD